MMNVYQKYAKNVNILKPEPLVAKKIEKLYSKFYIMDRMY